ncbi:hypothetical protein L4C54_12980 [Vibrio lamellibrachiae]|uniref:hypothetical protein n=1 Tax=Vibrio lamellibrachiae TaxID=2910253 RepID=UPI003D0E095D
MKEMKEMLLSINKVVNILLCITVILILSIDLYFSHLPELFSGGSRLLNTFYNLCVGYVVSYIFYVIVVHRKDYKEQQHVKNIIQPHIDRLLAEYYCLLPQIMTGKGNSERLTEILSPLEIIDSFKTIDPNSGFEGQLFFAPGNRQFHDRRSYLLTLGEYFGVEIAKLHKLFVFLDPELVRIFHSLEKCVFVNQAKHHLSFNINADSMSTQSQSFIEFSDFCRELEKYKS